MRKTVLQAGTWTLYVKSSAGDGPVFIALFDANIEHVYIVIRVVQLRHLNNALLRTCGMSSIPRSIVAHSSPHIQLLLV